MEFDFSEWLKYAKQGEELNIKVLKDDSYLTGLSGPQIIDGKEDDFYVYDEGSIKKDIKVTIKGQSQVYRFTRDVDSWGWSSNFWFENVTEEYLP